MKRASDAALPEVAPVCRRTAPQPLLAGLCVKKVSRKGPIIPLDSPHSVKRNVSEKRKDRCCVGSSTL